MAAANQAPWTFSSSDRLCEHSRDSGSSSTWLWSGARTWLAGVEELPSLARTGSPKPEPHCRAGLAPSDPHEPQQQSRRQVSATLCDWSLSPKLSTGHGNRPGVQSEWTLQSDRVTGSGGQERVSGGRLASLGNPGAWWALTEQEGGGRHRGPPAHTGAVGQRLSAPEKGPTARSGLRPSKK